MITQSSWINSSIPAFVRLYNLIAGQKNFEQKKSSILLYWVAKMKCTLIFADIDVGDWKSFVAKLDLR